MFDWFSTKKRSSSRRSFLRADFVREQLPTAREVIVLRPPGSVRERDFLAACTRCGECAQACPHGAIVPAPARFRSAAGTPTIDPANNPCRMCTDMPCAAACPTAAMTPDVGFNLGTAQIQSFNCLAHNRSFCSTCEERCPVSGAIELRDGKPSIRADLCSGCGICQHVCPAPINAVLLLPNRDRAAPSAEP